MRATLKKSEIIPGAVWRLAAFSLLLGGVLPAPAQWLTQPNVIRPGWTAVFLNVDASGYGESIDQLVGNDPANPIDQIWMWRAAVSPAQYISTPENSLSEGSYWIKWIRGASATPNQLQSLVGNSAYLIHSTAAANYTWRLQGKPVPPSYLWDITGLNLIGFSTPSLSPPNFQDFLAPAGALASFVELYQYTQGPLVQDVNPAMVFSQYITPVTRGQAFWIRATNMNNTYFGPFTVNLPNPSGIDYGTSGGQVTVHLANATSGTLTVTARMLNSEAAPFGQTNIVGSPPLLLEGALNASNLTYSYTALAASNSLSWTLNPAGQTGSELAVVLGVNRYALTGSPGSLYAGILQFKDSLGLSEVDVPVTAQSASTAGLWVGSASVSQVGSYLKSYATNADGSNMTDTNGAYMVTSVTTNLGAVVAPYPLRLIIHNDGTTSRLLQRVYYGLRQQTNIVVATTESVLDTATLNMARRISATQLPWTAANTPYVFTGSLALGGQLQTTVSDAYDDQTSNPFLHSYHPDHNNLDPTFKFELLPGAQSYNISRQITLTVSPAGADFLSLIKANASLSGTYTETLTLSGFSGKPPTFNTAGTFSLTRLSPIAALTTH